MMRKVACLLVISMVVLVSCSKDSDSSSNNGGGGTTVTCTGTKTWSGDVSPIIQSSCATNSGCHGSGSSNGPGELLTYTQVFNARANIRSAVASGSMPKTGTLTSTQKNNILCWIDSGAPNNWCKEITRPFTQSYTISGIAGIVAFEFITTVAYPNKLIRNPKTGQSFLFIQTAASTNGSLLEMQSTYDARSTEPPMHYHPYQTEDFAVLEGVLTVRMNEQQFELRPGETLHIPPNTAHAMWNNTDKKTTVNWQVRPAMYSENFLETFAGLAADNMTDENGRPTFLQTILLAKKFASVFRLAKPSFTIQKIVFSIVAPVAAMAGYKTDFKNYID